MPITRKQLLYGMLAALALAAGSGVFAIIMGDSDVVWRIAGTCLTAALAAAIMMPMSIWTDKPLTRLAGMVGMGIAVLEVLLASLIIWGDIFPMMFREFMGWTAGIIGGCGLFAVWFLKNINIAGWRLTARVGAIGCAASGAVFIAGAFDESFSRLSAGDKLFGTGMALFWANVAAALALVGWERRDAFVWRWLGVAGAGAAFCMTFYGIWINHGGNPTWPTGAYALAYVVAHAIVCFRATLTQGQRMVRWAAMAAAGATGALATIGVWLEPGGRVFEDFGHVWRLMSASALICISASMALIVFGRLNKKPVIELRKTVFEQVSVVCPRCEKKLTLPVGGALCDGCKLHINITLANTLCAQCGYDLTDLKADKCPECGSLVPTATKGLTEGIAP